MLWYRLKSRRNTESKHPKCCKGKKCENNDLSKCEVCGSKKSKPIKEQEASRLLSSLGINTAFSKNPLLGPLLF